MADKLEGSAIVANTVSGDRIVTGSITTTQLAPSVASFVNAGQPLKIQTITYPGDDTAANTGGGQTIILSGSGFKQNVQVYINSNAVPSVTYANANAISFTTPALTAATYPVYVINTDDGATAILIPGIQYSGTPTWTTTTPLTTQDASIAWNIQLVATSDSAVSYSLQAGSSLPAGITLAANGLISGTMTSPPTDETTYNFTVVANDLEQQDASRAFSVSVTVVALDPYFTYTTLLLHGDGTNNANNHAFVDSSNNNFTITRNGNATQGTFSPFGDNWSVYFDGTGDYLVAGTSTNLALGSGDFTIETFIFLTAINVNGVTVWDYRTSGNAPAGIPTFFINSSRVPIYYTGDGSNFTAIITGSAAVSLNMWNHIALVRSGSTVTMYLNGVSIGSATQSTNLGIQTFSINDPQGTFGGMGYISNFRIVKGTALYTSAFNSPTQPLTSVSNTSLLTCQSNAFVDKGPNRFAITRNGDARVSKFDPFKPYKAIPASYGVYFDGSGDYLSVPTAAVNNIGLNNYTIEGWFLANSFSTDTLYRRLWSFGSGINDSLALHVDDGSIAAAGRLVLRYNDTIRITSSSSISLGTWNHVAVVRNGSTTTLYLNGNSVGTHSTNDGLSTAGAGTLSIGASVGGSTGAWSGHISNFRIVKNTAVYTTTFTPGTAPLTAIANTSLLTCQSTTIIDNSTNAFTITRNGDARPTDLNPFTTTFVNEIYNTANGGGVVYLDGTGDYLGLPANTAWALGTNGSFEAWVYPLAYGSNLRIFSNVNDTNYIDAYVTSSGVISFSGGTLTTSTVIPLNSWTHIAFVLNAGAAAVYVNGRSVAISGTTTSLNFSNNNALSIGRLPSASGYEWNGYISSARLVKGTVTYRNNFVPPTEPPTNIANTSFLCNFTNAGIIDSVGKTVVETVASAKVSTSVKKYGSGSIDLYTNTNADYLTLRSSDVADLGPGDFTVEFWMYPQTLTTSYSADSYAPIFDADSSAGAATTAWWVVHQQNQGIYWGTNNGTVAGATGAVLTAANAWHHVAISRSSGVVRTFVNGNLANTVSYSTAIGTQNRTLHMGKQLSSGRYFKGYLDDVRITKGVGRYRYNFTPPTKTFNDGDGNLATLTSDVLPGDQVNTPAFPYTTLLLHGDGTNNANNHAFVDSSNNNFAITRNGNATQGTFSPFSPTGWSGYFDGSGDGISFGSNVNTNPSNSDITVEAWIYPLAYNSYGPIFSNDVNGGFHFGKIASGFGVRHYGTGDVVYTATTPPLNQWTHVAVSRSGNSWYLFYNGVLVATATASNTFTQGTACVGGNASTASEAWNGYLSNVRFVKGSALYTSNFTPSTTAITAVANTQLLTFQSNRFVDLSTNSYTATVFGTPSIQAFSPFAPSVEYTANTHGGSAYFDGTGDYLTTNATQAIPATGDFTVEAWIYPTDTFGRTIISQGTTGTAGRLQFNTASNNSLQLGIGTTIVYSSGTVTPNAWNYVAFTRTGSSVAFYINGSAAGTATASGSVQNTTLAIGSEWAGDPYRWLGYIGSVRVSNVLRTINSITTAPFSNDANTVFLANFTNAGILDSTGKNVLETVGDAKVNTAIKKYGTGSMYFDGTGDYLLTNATSTQQFAFGTGDFTIECWLYRSASATYQVIFDFRKDSSTDVAPLIYLVSGVPYYYTAGGDRITGSAAITNNTWVHLALCRSGTSTKLFVDGNQSGATYTDSNNYVGKSGRPIIGVEGVSIGASPYTGYIDDLRITKGIARYVQNFTPPTAAFLNK